MADIIFEDEESVVIRMRMRRASFDDLVMLCGSRTLALKAVREAVESLSSSGLFTTQTRTLLLR